VNDFAKELLNKPKRVAIESAHTEHEDITKRFFLADNLTQKEVLLQHFLATESSQQIIIFTATRSDTERLATLLTEQSLNAVALSGELNQGQRNQIMDSFAKGQHKILVTTDLASRGLDLINVSHVINFDMPKHTEEFVHRIGRTGRAGTKGEAISLVGPNDWLSFKNIEAFLQQKIGFTKVDGIKVKFKGLKPKKDKVVKAKVNTAKETKVLDNRPRKVI
jgi:superfamily II DNA/RNA helicase